MLTMPLNEYFNIKIKAFNGRMCNKNRRGVIYRVSLARNTQVVQLSRSKDNMSDHVTQVQKLFHPSLE